MANDSLASPNKLFSTLRYVGESRSYGHYYQRDGKIYVQQAVHARYLICFFRDLTTRDAQGNAIETWTSYDAAQAFIDFADSHFGIAWASHAVVDGKLRKVYVYQSNGSDTADMKFDPLAFNPPDEDTWGTDVRPSDVLVEHDATESERENIDPARVRLYVSTNGRIESGYVIDPGSGFYVGKSVNIDALADQKVSGDILPTVACVGGGFTIDRPLMIEEDDYPLTENKVERRCMIEFDISFIEERVEPGDPKRILHFEMNVDRQQ
ncbi:MAG: hypothetical protein ISN29_02600 [Gammaproteobacteria bacterium AqS3]|nr:hypothetical protein [Gammaproteobacteria bacterium AqS3]